jgi:hypothetical protein
MRKSKAVRVAGFVGALGASAALVGFAATGTGAYFTDSHGGALKASTGSVKLGISPTDGVLNFTDLLPGEYKTQQLSYQAQGSGLEDVWLVIPTDGTASALVGAPDSAASGLGRYGHFAVDAPAGSFTSYNLSSPRAGDNSVCSVDDYGHGGSNQAAATKDDYTPYCAPTKAILLSDGLASGQSATANITFGFTPLLKSGQNGPLGQVAAYKIVATQHGIRPDNPNN